MKPVWLVIGSKSNVVKNLSGKDHDTFVFESPFPAINYIKLSSLVEVVIYIAGKETDSSLKAISFLIKNIPGQCRLFVISGDNIQVSGLNIDGVDDIFTEQISASLIKERLNILKVSENVKSTLNELDRHCGIPLWKRIFDIFFHFPHWSSFHPFFF